MADGKVVIETGLDVKGLEKGLSKLEGITKKGFQHVKVAGGSCKRGTCSGWRVCGKGWI